MILFQVFYRRTEEEARDTLALEEASIKNPTSIQTAPQIDWPLWFTRRLEEIGMEFDANRVWTLKLECKDKTLSPVDARRAIERDAEKLLTWFNNEYKPWACALSKHKSQFAQRVLAHAIDDEGLMAGAETF